MSADNGIYILKTKGQQGDQFEYRVAHAMAIDNLTYNAFTGKDQADFIPEEAFAFFGYSTVHSSEGPAREEASLLEKSYYLLEYGVCLLDFSHQEYPRHLTNDDYVRYQVEVDKAIARHRAKREEERQAWVEKNRVPIPGGGAFVLSAGEKVDHTFRPRIMYGELEAEDGTKTYGSVTPAPDGEWYFLPMRESTLDRME